MPTVDGSRSLLAAGANYNAGDWANVGAEASLDLLASANLNRGFDLGLGVEALARIDGTLRQFLAADVNGENSRILLQRKESQLRDSFVWKLCDGLTSTILFETRVNPAFGLAPAKVCEIKNRLACSALDFFRVCSGKP